MNMIDIHTHFLPGMDDGARNVKMSLEMLRLSTEQGVGICVSTSHCRLHHRNSLDSFLERRAESWSELKKSIQNDVPQILLGAEVLLDHDISKYDGIERLCIGDSRYMLTEFPHMEQDIRTAEWLYELTLSGIKPVIAHIDRYPAWEKLISDLGGVEVLYQVNAEMFLSFAGRHFITKLAEKKIDFIVSSDMHNITSRKCNMGDAYKKAVKKYKTADADNMFAKNAECIIKAAVK